jgi:nicotinate-nucleotide pyrophosphorylase (carboxylating)
MNKRTAYSRNLKLHRKKMISRALEALGDDVDAGDITSNSTVRKQTVDAIVKSKSKCILCGLVEAEAIMKKGKIKIKKLKKEGDKLKKGTIIMKMKGDIKEILKRERTCINYLQRLSGIATQTYELCSKYPGKVSSLRKVAPGLLFSEKRAVEIGGGFTHRTNLSDGFLIKDNHIASVIVEQFGGKFTEKNKVKGIWECLYRAKKYRKKIGKKWPIEVEVESMTQALAAVEYFKINQVPDMILLDNFKPKELKKVVKKIRKEIGKKILLEASGGIKPGNIKKFLDTGVDLISTSYLTLGAPPADISLDIIGYK